MGRLRHGLVLAAALALVFAACADDDDGAAEGERGPITIGLVMDQSGILELYDTSALVAAELAIEDINAEGGVAGRQLESIEADYGSEPAKATNAAITLLDQGADVMVVGCDFDLGGGAAAIEANRRGVMATSTCGASTKFGPEAGGELVFTMATSGPAQGAVMADFAQEQGYERAFAIEETTADFYTQAEHGFEERWQQLGGELVGKGKMDTFEDRSFGPQISAIEESNPDFLWLNTFPPGSTRFLRQAQAAGIDLPVLTTGDMDGDYWKGALGRPDGIFYNTYGSIYGDDPEPTVNELMDRYERETGNPAELSLGIITGYSAIQAIAQAVEQADGATDGEELARVMEGWEEEEFLVGPTTFTDDLHIALSRDFRIMEVQDGKTSFVKLLAPGEVSLP